MTYFKISLPTRNWDIAFFIAPIIIEQHAIGLFYADRADSGQVLSREDYFCFTHFVQQTNLCLSVVMKKKE